MNNKLLVLLLLVSFTVSSQELMSFNGHKGYKATSQWNFICENYALTGFVNVQIAKTDTNGILKLAVETTNPKFIIAGTIYVYLTDNTIITCLDKGNSEVNGNTIIGYYSFSNSEMEKLKNTDIASIRFNIKGDYNVFSSQLGNFTAYNKTSLIESSNNKVKRKYVTAKELTSL
ncbi:hypothetical protein [Flavobacterium sp. WC2409]|uniref:Uncharacterized protein n=3 Tax=unclassified Flavobacterium TaxID=196869 RepID=A0AB39W860_9FLAO